jgi:4-amino-4-deoxy-L-arabinose transferase-like glycosyltransferase
MPLPSSFWTDETATAFVVHYGPGHPSLAVAPTAQSIYYWLPRTAEALGGFSETAYRLPSLLAMAIALFLIARLAARLIDPRAAWLAAFACLALRGFNFQAADARPYALGSCIAIAALWFLLRWFDRARWRDAAFFVVLAALLWRV